MIGIKDYIMPKGCSDCCMQQIAYDSDLFEDGEPYCCIKGESVDTYMDEKQRPEWCPLIETE